MTTKTKSLRSSPPKRKRAKVDYKYKNQSSQMLRAVVNAKEVTKCAARNGMSKRQAMKIRSLHKQGKLSPAELTRLRDRCILEAIRHVQKRPQKKLAHNVNCPQVKERYVEAVKASKEFSPLAKTKTPNDKIFRKFIQQCKQQSPDGTLRSSTTGHHTRLT
jgi:hypothetical protein